MNAVTRHLQQSLGKYENTVAGKQAETVDQPSETPAAARMRRMRDKRKRGFRCAVEVSQVDITTLIAAGLLDQAKTDDFSN